MIYNKKGTKNKLKNFNIHNTIIVTDFDATLTTSNCKSSWSIIPESQNMPPEFYNNLNSLNRKYAPYEMDMLLLDSFKEFLTTEWTKNELNLLIDHNYNENNLIEAVNKENSPIKLRKGVKQIFSLLNNLNIKTYIVSAGLANSIEILLKKNNCLLPNINIIANKLKFENNIAKSIENSHIINIYNKNIALKNHFGEFLDNNLNIILLGDILHDADMCNKINCKNIVKIGFFENKSNDLFNDYKNTYDIICTDNTDLLKLTKFITNKINGVSYI